MRYTSEVLGPISSGSRVVNKGVKVTPIGYLDPKLVPFTEGLDKKMGDEIYGEISLCKGTPMSLP